mgnify:CR=1 FL=1
MNSKYKWKGGERLMRPAKGTAWNLAVRNDICCKELFPGSDIVRSYTFKTAAPRGQSALLAKLNHMLTAAFAAAGSAFGRFADISLPFLQKSRIVLNAFHHISSGPHNQAQTE